jgi:hypothetical protein
MMVRLSILLILSGLSACASNNLRMAHGPWHQLNQGKWALNENTLVEPPAGLSR